MNISIKDICNLSRIPICMENNPLYLTSLQILNNKNIESTDTYLYNFHKEFKPKTLGQLFGIKNSLFPILDLSYSTSFLPWLHYQLVRPERGSKDVRRLKDQEAQEIKQLFNITDLQETGAPRELGHTGITMHIANNQYVCKRGVKDVAFVDFNVSRKVLKLKQLISSISKHGYIPEKFPTRQGGICGYFLQHENQKKFYITAGNHRSAVLAAMYKDNAVPVIFENKSFLKEKELKDRGPILNTYSSKNVDTWPSVKHNNITRECALQIINTYFNN